MNHGSNGNWRVLLIDDDEDDYILAKAMLSQAQGRKIDLDWAPTFEKGQEFLQSDQYQAILVDYDLGAKTGIELIREATECGCPAPLILYTGRGSYQVDVEAMEAGATLYLTKSEANPLLLERAIRYAIENKQMKAELELRFQERSEILESIQDGFLAIDRDWQITYINHRAASNGGYELEDLIGRNVWDAFPKLAGTEFEENYRNVMERRSPVKFQVHGVYKDQWYSISVYPSVEGISIYWQDISEAKKAEAELRKTSEALAERNQALQEALTQAEESQRMLEALMEYVPEGITIAEGKDATIRMVSRYGQDILGGPHDQKTVEQVATEWRIYQMDGFTELPAEDLPLMRAIHLGEIVKNQELIQVNAAGQALYLSCNAGPIRDASGNILGAVVAWRDIGDIKQAGEALFESEKKFRTLYENLNEAMAIDELLYDENGSVRDWRFLDVNPAFLRYTERSRDEIIGRSLTEIYGIDHAPEPFLSNYTHVVKTGQPVQFEGYFDELRMYMLISAFPLGGDRFATLTTDITARKQAEEALRKNEERLVDYLESTHDSFFALDHELRITYANRHYCEMIGMEPEELIGNIFWEIFPKYPGTTVEANYRKALEERGPVHFQSRGFYTQKYYDVSVYPTRDGGISVFSTDRTEQHEAELALQEYAEKLKRSNQALEDFAFIASHDLKEPLRKVQAFGNMLNINYSPWLDEVGQDYIQRMQSAAERMQIMLDGLLEYSRAATQGKPFEKIELYSLIQSVLSDLDVRIQETGGQVEVGKLPVIEGDPIQIRQLFQNLVNNALKFHRPGVPPVVRVFQDLGTRSETSAHITRPLVTIAVEDNGIGLDMKQADQLFKPFSRLVGKSDYVGSGMGLAICRKIVERHGGSISAQSELGEGSTFMVRLPNLH